MHKSHASSLFLDVFVLQILNCIVVFTDGTIYFQVFDLSDVKPSDFIRYGLGCLERLAERGDNCAKNIRGNLRIMVCAFFFADGLLYCA
jgi:hypothetical protein